MTTSIAHPATSRQSATIRPSATRARVTRHDRVAPLRQPRVLKPDWDRVDEGRKSNTYGYSSAPVARSISKDRAARISGTNERVFEERPSHIASIRARVDRVVHSPGATMVSLGAMSALVGLAPILIP